MSVILTEAGATPADWTVQNNNFASAGRIYDTAQAGNSSLIFLIAADPLGGLKLFSTIDFGATVVEHALPVGLTAAELSYRGLAVTAGNTVVIGDDSISGVHVAQYDGVTPLLATDYNPVPFFGTALGNEKYGVYAINNTIFAFSELGSSSTGDITAVASVPRIDSDTTIANGGSILILDSGVVYINTTDMIVKSVDEGLTISIIGEHSSVTTLAQGDPRRATMTATQGVFATRPISGNSLVYYRLLETTVTAAYSVFTFPFGLIQTIGYNPLTNRLYITTLNGADVETYYSTVALASTSGNASFWTKDERVNAPNAANEVPDVFMPIRSVAIV